MELHLTAYIKFDTKSCLEIGEIILLNNEFVRLKEHSNCELYKLRSPSYFVIKRDTYSVVFLDKYHENYQGYNVSIQIQDSFLFFVKINWFQKLKLKWMLKSYIIQSKEMKMDVVKYAIGIAFGAISTFTTQEVIQIYNKEPFTPPKTGIQKSFQYKNSQNISR